MLQGPLLAKTGDLIRENCSVAVEPRQRAVTAASVGANITISPNPATETLTASIGVNNGDMLQLTLFDLNGRAVLRQSVAATGPTTIAIGHLQPGFYLARLTDGKAQALLTTKMILQK